MQELEEYFAALHYEILRVREVGYENTEIIDKSERFFEICDEATGLAEAYSQRKASSLTVIEKYITIDIIVLMLLIGYEFIKAVRFAAMNRALQKRCIWTRRPDFLIRINAKNCWMIRNRRQRMWEYAVLT